MPLKTFRMEVAKSLAQTAKQLVVEDQAQKARRHSKRYDILWLKGQTICHERTPLDIDPSISEGEDAGIAKRKPVVWDVINATPDCALPPKIVI
jgi:hypothetical protein